MASLKHDANCERIAAVRRAVKEAWLVDGNKTDLDADRLALAALAAVAQSDARRLPHGECSYCDQYGDDPMMPSHTASERCESGKRPHCTCDTCF